MEKIITPILERFSLVGKTALVTGGAQGIGEAFSRALYEAGAHVAIVDKNKEKAEQTAHAILQGTKAPIEPASLHEEKFLSASERVICIACDVTIESEIEKTINCIIKKWGKLTIGVNNAGIGVWSDAESQEEMVWRKVLEINLTGVYLCCKHEGRHMLKQEYGKIINTASMSGHIINWPQNQTAYNASKAGVIHLTRSLAAEWAGRGVRVNSISPGYTKTKLVDALIETPLGQDMMPKWLARIPMGKMADVQDLQGAVVYLASEASDYMTGSDLIIDGGYCCW